MRIIFVTNQFGPKVLYDDIGLIGKFKDAVSNVVQGDDGIKRRVGKSLWYMILEKEELIERARKYPGFGVMFKETTTEPVWKTLDNIRTIQDPNSPAAVQANKPIEADIKATAERETESVKKAFAAKSRRYGELFSLVCKAGGEILKNADPVLVNEFKHLQTELGITETVEQEEAEVVQ